MIWSNALPQKGNGIGISIWVYRVLQGINGQHNPGGHRRCVCGSPVWEEAVMSAFQYSNIHKRG